MKAVPISTLAIRYRAAMSSIETSAIIIPISRGSTISVFDLIEL